MYTLCGDIEQNPGPAEENKDRASDNTNTSNNSNNPTFYYQNIRSLKNKMDTYHSELNVHLINNTFDFVAFTETWLNSTVLDSELYCDGFTIHRRDRNDGRRGGGVLFLASNQYKSRRLEHLEKPNIEILWVEIKLSKTKRVLVAIIYRPPNSGRDVMLQLAQSVEDASAMYSRHHIVLIGDLNLSEITWTNDGSRTAPANSLGELFIDCFINGHNLFQCNVNPTCNNNVLDLILCNNSIDLISDISAGQNIFESDHSSISFILKISIQKHFSRDSRQLYCFKAVNNDDLLNAFNVIPFDLIHMCNDINNSVSLFYDLVDAALRDLVPIVRPKRKMPPWFDNKVRVALKNKEKCFGISKRLNTHESKHAFSVARKEFKVLMKLKYKSYMQSLSGNLKANPKRFWSWIKTKTKSSSYPSVMSHGHKVAETTNDKAALFNSYFHSVFRSGPSVTDEHQRLPEASVGILNAPIIQSEIVNSLLSSIQTHKASGCDNLSNHVLKHGFVAGRSCETNLATLLTTVYEAIDDRKQCDIIYTDFSKAFDLVPHNLLLFKLQRFGFHYDFISWFRSYLNGRFQRVVIEGISSEWLPIHSGVPQGSILGPLLFNLFVNDIPKLFTHSRCLMFADDVKLYKIIGSVEDADRLQVDLDKLCSWAALWESLVVVLEEILLFIFLLVE
ncbi:uncharacterized protein [Antedon mediterranea]|uniref:uncharacterized protein n=1 Tax=Antedon mediterranea TaxID=105859 RepID=UPI003AF44F0C